MRVWVAGLVVMWAGVGLAWADQVSPAPALTAVGAANTAELCQDFTHNADDSWTARHKLMLQGPNSTYPDRKNVVQVNPYEVFTPGVIYSDLDVAGLLDKSCAK